LLLGLCSGGGFRVDDVRAPYLREVCESVGLAFFCLAFIFGRLFATVFGFCNVLIFSLLVFFGFRFLVVWRCFLL
jgi:hypothetical protein